jgi:hypothetical protein
MIKKKARLCALLNEPFISCLESETGAFRGALAARKCAQAIHDDVAASRSPFFVLSSDNAICAKRENELVAFLQNRSKWLGLDVEKPVWIVRPP